MSVMFSEEPDRTSAENSFSLTEDGAVLAGEFAWDRSSLTFLPYRGLSPNADYRITVSADARTPRGVSLGQPFEAAFSSKPEDARPVVISTIPEREGILEIKNGTISIIFSEAVDAVLFRECLSLSPAIKGTWKLEPGGSSATFTPLEPWTWGTDYELTISADLIDTSGNRMGQSYASGFTVGLDRDPPVLTSAEAIDENGLSIVVINADKPQDQALLENHGWEASWKLRLHFSEPVSRRSLDSTIEAEGGIALEPEWAGEFTEIVDLRVSEYPDWGTNFAVHVPAGTKDAAGNTSLVEAVFRFVFDGPRSRPPRFVGIRLPLAPGEAAPSDRDLAVFSVDNPYATIAIEGDVAKYPIGVPVATSIEVYVDLAAGASLDLLSLMKSFRFSSTNGALDFSANRMVAGYLKYAEPYEPWAAYAVARIDGLMTNRVDSGIISLQLASGLMDSSGNASGVTQRLPLLK
ncbi:MAG: hypothetical protein A2Y38_05060 [Spirochaetes bacterium GWB1_59_5]|nr:MAG: hypothetical protein A2Y38_05060 [Spirochaetes bacterium GWB1_59_5]